MTPDAIDYMLRKSGECDLAFRHLVTSGDELNSAETRYESDFLELSTLHMDRCSSLTIGVKYGKRMEALIRSSAPRLREATVFAGVPNFSEPAHLFGGHAEALEDLMVSEVPIRWDLGLPSKLRRADLSFRSLQTAQIPRAQDIVSALASYPEIEALRITGGDRSVLGGEEPWTVGAHGPQLKLPRLRKLKLEDMTMNVSYLIQAGIHAPGLRVLELKERSTEMDGQFLRRPAPILQDTIRKALHHNKLFSIAAGSGPTVFQILGEERHVSLSFRCRDPAEFSDWLANQFGPELSSVTEVHLRVSYAAASTVGPHSLRRLLESLDDVERLICPSASAGIENLLADHLGTPHGTSDGWHWSWPMIKHVELYDSWRWSDLVLSMLRSRYQPANPGDGK
ncbi:hypothetical protein FRB90_004036 [Tulasnella sp. 427]|nr:hypothetical protein FRB90_004036 [Tulasnella sp. 427]